MPSQENPGRTGIPLTFYVNGELVQEKSAPLETNLATYLRKTLHLTGTKVGCGEGGCGSCTVIVSRFNPGQNTFSHCNVNSCITPLYTLHGCHVLTVEGIGNVETNSCSYLQDAIARGHGTQCGFCTPGVVMSMHNLFSKTPNPDIGSIKNSLSGNLCRCTGYRPILDSFQKCASNKACLQAQGQDIEIEDYLGCTSHLIDGPRNVTQEPRIGFPEIENTILTAFHSPKALNKMEGSLRFGIPKSDSAWWFPNSLDDLKRIVEEETEVSFVGGYTGLFTEPFPEEKRNLVYLGGVPELRVVEKTGEGLVLGAALTISEMILELEALISTMPGDQTKIYAEIVNLVKQFGSEQIRNTATIGGSLTTTNPASDVQTLFSTFSCKSIRYEFDQHGPSSISLIAKVIIPFSNKLQAVWSHKVMRRAINDAAFLNVAVLIEQNPINFVNTLVLSVGGTGVIRSRHERVLSDDTVSTGSQIAESITPRAVEDELYVQILASNIERKFDEWCLGKEGFVRNSNSFSSTQLYIVSPEGQHVNDLIGKPVPHAAAHKHTTGEAEFLDDISKAEGELALAFISSQRARARILRIDTSKSRALDGVVGFVFHDDLKSPSKNWFGVAVPDEEIFASTEVHWFGQTIGGVLAKDAETAERGAALVVVEYEDLPPVLTMQNAIKNDSFYSDWGLAIRNGDCPKILETCDHVISGSLEIGGQIHFYMEPQGCLAIPKKDGEIEVISSTQWPSEIQHQVADKLGIPANRVIAKVRRVGGGFGGKETRCLLAALPTAVAAQKFRRPVRCILTRKTDMIVSGKRHPYEGFYTVGFNSDGRLLGLTLKLYCDAGASLDVSMATIERALVNIDNAYNIPNMDLEGFVCKTNVSSNTVFRGTGGPQAAIFIESVVDQVATYLGMDPIQLRTLNMYKEGDVTHYGQTLYKSTVSQCWEECLSQSGYYERKAAVDAYNKENEYKKRGISMNPAHFGIAYTALALNQGAALVHIYKDGSVMLNHGGVELGQGVHSKMTQIATRELGIPAGRIRIVETSTDKVPNATPTSASCTSDLQGMAVLDACRKLMKRLEPYKLDLANKTWEQIVSKAYESRVGLSATGFYKVPGIGWNEARRGSPFNYFSSGAACTEVELDCLTGQHQILRTDIVMDVGQSLNPAIDVGQIEGAFMQGVGLCTFEELKFSEAGKLETTGPSTYKIPSVSDTPLQFNVSFLKGSSNPRAIYSSKTVGEPPLLLAASVLLAIKDAVRSYRKSKGIDVNFTLHTPATIQKIVLACNGSTN